MQEQAPPGRAGQEDATVIVSEREMEGWPGTPGQMRIERARDAREAGRGDWIFEPEAGRGRDQAILDIERLRETGMNMEFQDWAKREFHPGDGRLPGGRAAACDEGDSRRGRRRGHHRPGGNERTGRPDLLQLRTACPGTRNGWASTRRCPAPGAWRRWS